MSAPEHSSLPPYAGEIRAYLTGMGSPKNVRVTLLAEGFHSAAYVCEHGPAALPDRFVARRPTNPEGERAIRSAAVELGGLPVAQFYHLGVLALNHTPVIFEEYVEGVHRQFDDLAAAEIGALATAVATIHDRTNSRFSQTSGAEPLGEGTYADYLRAMVADSVTNRQQGLDMGPHGAANKVIRAGLVKMDNILQTSHTSFSMKGPFSLLHRDITPKNVIWRFDGSPVLIDPYYTYGDPADDLVYTFVNNHTSNAFKSDFLKAYIAATGRYDTLERISAYALRHVLDDLVWFIARQQSSPDNQDYTEAYQQRLSALQLVLE